MIAELIGALILYSPLIVIAIVISKANKLPMWPFWKPPAKHVKEYCILIIFPLIIIGFFVGFGSIVQFALSILMLDCMAYIYNARMWFKNE